MQEQREVVTSQGLRSPPHPEPAHIDTTKTTPGRCLADGKVREPLGHAGGGGGLATLEDGGWRPAPLTALPERKVGINRHESANFRKALWEGILIIDIWEAAQCYLIEA